MDILQFKFKYILHGKVTHFFFIVLMYPSCVAHIGLCEISWIPDITDICFS